MEEQNESPRPPGDKAQGGRSSTMFGDIVHHFENLKERYPASESGRPSVRYILAITFWILLFAWWISALAILAGRGTGSFWEGYLGFAMMMLVRTGFGSMGVAAVIWGWRTYARHRISVPMIIFAACMAVGLFFLLRNPIRDIPYLSNPQTIVLTSWDAEFGGGSTSDYPPCRLKSKDEDGVWWYFNINEDTYYDLPVTDDTTVLEVKYLPYTHSVMSVMTKMR